jgi:hypothetical protein
VRYSGAGFFSRAFLMHPSKRPSSVFAAGVFRAAALFAAWATAEARADIRFTQAEITLKGAPGDAEIRGSFTFTNTGDAAVEITRVASGCGCTVPEKPAGPVAAGAKGAIPVVYRPGTRQGPQSQTIVVETSDGKSHELRVLVDVPARVSFAPRLVLFRGGETGPKTATLTYAAETKTRLLGVSTQAAAFAVEGESRLDGDVLKLSIRHVGDATAEARGTVRVLSRDGAGREHTDLVYVRHTP